MSFSAIKKGYNIEACCSNTANVAAAGTALAHAVVAASLKEMVIKKNILLLDGQVRDL